MNVTLRTMGGSINHFAEALPVFSPLTKKIAAFVGIIFAAMISIYAILKLTEKAASTFDEQFDDMVPIVKRKIRTNSSKVDNVITTKITKKNVKENTPKIKKDGITDVNQPKQETEVIEVLVKKSVNLNLTLQNILDKAEEEFKNDPLKSDIIKYIDGQAQGQYNSDQIVSKFQIQIGREKKQFTPSGNSNDTIVEKAAGVFLQKLGIEVHEVHLSTEPTNPSQKVII